MAQALPSPPPKVYIILPIAYGQGDDIKHSGHFKIVVAVAIALKERIPNK